jgi:hypothetical protein
MNSFLHIISFDIPFPANYGGVIDIFYKIKALQAQNIKIILHNFQYGDRVPNIILEKLCTRVYYYPRDVFFWKILSAQPFIVNTRAHPDLLKRLKEDNYPILFEGLHTCFYLNKLLNCDRQYMIRMHNIEWQYYQNLAHLEPKWWKQLFFKWESIKLKYFEKQVLKQNPTLLAIAPNDFNYFKKIHPNTHLILPFHGHHTVNAPIGIGNGALFHGKLSVSDNEQAALFLIEKVFAHSDMPFTIAGLNPSKLLIIKAKAFKNIKIIANPDDELMDELIQKSHIQILLSFQTAGLKLKLLNALYSGRHCIVNTPMVAQTGLDSLCHVADTPEQMLQMLHQVAQLSFSTTISEKRRIILENIFSDELNASQIINLMNI